MVPAPGSVSSTSRPLLFATIDASASTKSLIGWPRVGATRWTGSLASSCIWRSNDCGELLACRLTAGKVDDRRPVLKVTRRLWGKLFADKGYRSQALFEQLLDDYDLQLITKLKTKMKNRLMSLSDKLLLRKRAILEVINDQLKTIPQIEHTRHRSLAGFMVNLVCGLIADCHQPKKPSLHLDQRPLLESLIQT